jgi:hypothetical protein
MHVPCLRSTLVVSLLSLSLYLVPGRALAQERWLSADLAWGVSAFFAGPSSIELGAPLDLGVSLTPREYLLARASLGLFPAADRHTVEALLRTRIEAAARLPLARFVGTLGGGGSLLGLSPAAHGLLGLGIRLSPHWELGLDLRAGALWDRHATRPGATDFWEAQLRVSWAFL